MKKIVLIYLTLFVCVATQAQDFLKLKDNRKTFTGQMIRLDWSSFKFQLPDGGIIQQVTEQIDSVYLSDATQRVEAMRIETLRPRITSTPLQQISLPVMAASQQKEMRLKEMSFALHQSGARLKMAGIGILAFLGCTAAALTYSVKNHNDQVPVFIGAVGLGFFVTSGIELILAGSNLQQVQKVDASK